MERRLPVPVSAIPAETRAVKLLFDIDAIAQRAENDRAVKDYTAKAIREALVFKPTLAIEVERSLGRSGQLLWQKGHRPQPSEETEPKGKTLDQAVAEQMKTYDYRAPISSKAREGVVRSALRQIARVVHPDSTDELAPHVVTSAFAQDDRTRALAKASELSRSPDSQSAEEAQRLLLETMPRYYLTMFRTLMASGQNLAEIAAKYPEAVAEMETLRWIAENRFQPETSYRRFKTTEDADKQAAMIRRKPEHHARTIACAMVAGVYGEVVAFGTNKGLPEEALREFKQIQEFMKNAFGYVGGTGEFIVQNGERFVTTKARNLVARLDDAVRALPDKIFSLTEATTAEEADSVALKKAQDSVRYAVATVNGIARDYAQELEDEANGRNRYPDYSGLFGNSKSGRENIISYNPSKRKEENFIRHDSFSKEYKNF